MNTKYARFFCLLFSFMLAFIFCLFCMNDTAYAQEMQIQSKAALLMEAYSGETIFAENEHEKLFPASITKIMVLLLALEGLEKGEIGLKEEVLVSKHSSSMGGSTLFLSAGDVVELESLLIGVTVGSATMCCSCSGTYRRK